MKQTFYQTFGPMCLTYIIQFEDLNVDISTYDDVIGVQILGCHNSVTNHINLGI
jgi:hypothetical protein